MGVIDQAFQTEYQLANQWDLFFDDDTSNMQFRVSDVTMPDYGFEIETLMTGEKIYKKLEDVDEVSITLRETPYFETYQYFAEWRSQIYDFEKRVFKKHVDDSHLKNLTLVFYQMYPVSLSPSMVASLGSAFKGSIAPALSATANIGADLGSMAGFDVPIGKKSMVYKLQNCKIQKIEGVTLSYVDGKPIEFTVTLKPEFIYYEYNSGPLDKVNKKVKSIKNTINNKIRSKFK